MRNSSAGKRAAEAKRRGRARSGTCPPEFFKDFGGAMGGVGMGEAAGESAHAEQFGAIGRQAGDFVEKTAAVHFAVGNEAGGADARHRGGVVELMIVGGKGKGNEDRRFACGGDFGYGSRAG